MNKETLRMKYIYTRDNTESYNGNFIKIISVLIYSDFLCVCVTSRHVEAQNFI